MVSKTPTQLNPTKDQLEKFAYCYAYSASLYDAAHHMQWPLGKAIRILKTKKCVDAIKVHIDEQAKTADWFSVDWIRIQLTQILLGKGKPNSNDKIQAAKLLLLTAPKNSDGSHVADNVAKIISAMSGVPFTKPTTEINTEEIEDHSDYMGEEFKEQLRETMDFCKKNKQGLEIKPWLRNRNYSQKLNNIKLVSGYLRANGWTKIQRTIRDKTGRPRSVFIWMPVRIPS